MSFLPSPGAGKGRRETLGTRLFNDENDGILASFLNAFGDKDLMDMYVHHPYKNNPIDEK